MGADLILAMAIAALITRAWEQSKRRSRASWQETRQRASEHWQRRADRLRAASSKGPRDPLWWPYAAGWTVAAVGTATAAGLHGLGAGALAGARTGYRFGREGANRGWGYRETWKQWRSRRDIEQCQGCGQGVNFELIVIVPSVGRVCPDCRSSRHNGRRRDSERRDEDEVVLRRCAWCSEEFDPALLDEDGWCANCARGACDGNCTNSDQSPSDAEREGHCGDCAGRGEYVSNFGGRHRHTRCRTCSGSGASSPKTSGQPGSGGGDVDPSRIYVHAERTDVNEESTKEIGGNKMGELMPANGTALAATGEGYADTIASLSTMAMLLGKAYEEAQSLGEALTANSLDNDTIGQISDLTDLLETAAPLAANLYRHVEQRHAPVADAVAGAGGSGNVAEKSWYDHY